MDATGKAAAPPLGALVESLVASYRREPRGRHLNHRSLPARAEMAARLAASVPLTRSRETRKGRV